MLRASTALVQLQYPCTLSESDDLGGGERLLVAGTDCPGRQVILAPMVRGDQIWMVRDDWRVEGGGTISVQGGLLVAGTDGPGGTELPPCKSHVEY